MEPRIQYAKTTDGVSLALWTLGEGEPFILLTPLGFSHIQLEWEEPQLRRWYERLAVRRMIIRFDYRGFGLSDRTVTAVSPETDELDLVAVAKFLGVDKFSLYAGGGNANLAISFAARRPERVARIVLWRPLTGTILPNIDELLDRDWELFTETFAHVFLGWSEGELAHRWAWFIRQSVNQETFRRMVDAHAGAAGDATALLADVSSPVLLLDRPQLTGFRPEQIRAFASGIPNSRVAFLEGRDLHLYVGDIDAGVKAVEEFLDEGAGSQAVAAAPTQASLVTILFTDLASSTALTQRLGDAKAQELVRAHNTIVRDALRDHGGSEIKHTGDGIMASFPTASGALECAVAIQRAVGARDDGDLQVHIGLNAGEPVAEEQDLFGTSVQLARRICDHAEAGQILASNVVRELAAGKGFLFSDRGEQVLRGFEDPVRLYELAWREQGEP